MRLLETSDGRTYQLTENYLENDLVPAYTILSHTWEDNQEVIFEDLVQNSKSMHRKLRKSLRLRPQPGKKGYDKLDFCARRTKCDGLRYFWVDTCCIDKKSSSELHLSINSMYKWYKNAKKCYVYLSDVSTRSSRANDASLPWQSAFAESRWFTRGWTLQELLAPTVVEFYSREGRYLGNRLELKQEIHEITDIPILALSGASLDLFSVDERLSWAVERQTKREEDEVYALLGIFDIELPFIYDEGYDKALRRLLDNIEASRGTQLEPDLKNKRLLKSILPFRRDADFIARDHLDLAYLACKTSGGCAALIGLGGTGKSQTAVECCYRIVDESATTRVFWVHAETRERLKEGYLQIAKKTNLDGWDDPKTDVVQLVHAWLCNEANGRWLLVLDSADDMDVFSNQSSSYDEMVQVKSATTSSPLPTFLPRTSTGSILITTRNHEVARMLVGAECSIIEVGPMNNQDAFALLKAKFKAYIKKSEADALITALDHMPLALTQAAAFIQRTPRMTISRYLDEIGHDPAPLMRRGYLVDTRRDAKASNSIMKTWQMSFDYIRKRSSAAARLLSLMSMFDRQGIPKSLLVDAYTDHDHGPSDFDHDMYMLTSFCLVKATADEDMFEMHGLVQASTRKWLEHHGELEYWKRMYVVILNKGFPEGQAETRTVCRKLLPHAQKALDNHPLDADGLEAWASVSWKAAWYMGQMGEYDKAYKLALDSLDIREILLHPDDPELLDSLNTTGVALSRLGRYEEAETMYERAAETQDRLFGSTHLDTLVSKLNLASLYHDQGHWAKAESLLSKLLVIANDLESKAGRSLRLSILTTLATVYSSFCRHHEAAALELQILEARERDLGPDHPITATVRSNLAYTYSHQGRFQESEALNLQVLRDHEMNGHAQTEILASKAHLAANYEAQGRWDEAESLRREVLSKTQDILGPAHPDTLYAMGNLACTHNTRGRFSEASALQQQVLGVRTSTWGEDHPSTLATKSNLAHTYWNLGRYAEAETLLLEVLAVRESKLGAEHPLVLDAKATLASVYCRQKRHEEALQLDEMVLKFRKKVMGEEHPRTLASMGNLAVTYRRLGFAERAFELMEQCYHRHVEVMGEGHPITGRYKEGLEKWRRGEEHEDETQSAIV